MGLEAVAIGPGEVYLAPVAEAYPTDPDTAVGGNWVQLGRFEEKGLVVSADITKTLIRSAQDLDPIAAFISARELAVDARLLEITIENIKYAFGSAGTISTDAGPPATKTWSPGAVSADHALLIRQPFGYQQTYPRDVQMPQVTVMGSTTLPMGPDDASSIGIKLIALTPTAGGNAFTIVDQTGAA